MTVDQPLYAIAKEIQWSWPSTYGEEKYVVLMGGLHIVPWMFAMDHFHYARWLSVHVRDLIQLERECPKVWNEFLKGHFVMQKTSRKFSMMAHNQIHEQLNAIVKGDGGVIGVTENEAALRHWMIAGPETGRIISELSVKHSSNSKSSHHEQIPSTQSRFAANVRSVIDVINEMGNPFMKQAQICLILTRRLSWRMK